MFNISSPPKSFKDLDEYRHFVVKNIVTPLSLVGLFILVFYAIGLTTSVKDVTGWTTFTLVLKILGGGAAVSAAAFALGGITGFLFAVPRTGSASPSGAEATNGGAKQIYTPNTNLEKASDWMTTILIGLGLSNIPSIVNGFKRAAEFAAPAISFQPALPAGATPPVLPSSAEIAFCLFLIVYFLAFGFFASYLYARIFLQAAFAWGDRAMSVGDAVIQINSEHAKRPPGVKGPEDATGAPSGKPSGDDAVSTLVQKPLTAMKTTEYKLAWARAQLDVGNIALAIEGYRAAKDESPMDDSIKFELIILLAKVGRLGEAKELLKCIPNPTGTADNERALAYYKTLMLTELYEPAPEGFKSVSELYETVFGPDGVLKPDADIHAYAACAYGQQYTYVKEHNGTEGELKEIKEKALTATKEALLSKQWKPTLRWIWTGDNPVENDLAAFKNDREFKALLG